MKRKARTLLRPYQAALLRYLQQGSTASLRQAQTLGRQAMALQLDALDLALIHEQALLARALPVASHTVRDDIRARARTFFARAILPMEETHRAAMEANARLCRLNEALKQRTADLSKSNRDLKREIARRGAAEKSLRENERHSALLLEQSRCMQEQLRLLSRRIVLAQEEERKRISRELHDVIAQMLTGINVRLAALKTEALANAKGLSQKISRTQRLVEKSVAVVHRFARQLRPMVLDDLGLIPALHSFLKSFKEESGIRVSLTAFAGVERVSGDKRTALYRVAQEAMSNIARHAQATRVDVSIQELPNAVRLQIADDGKAFDVERMWRTRKSRHLGMLGMRERVEMVGGTFAVESAPGRGTTLRADIPFKNGRGAKAEP